MFYFYVFNSWNKENNLVSFDKLLNASTVSTKKKIHWLTFRMHISIFKVLCNTEISEMEQPRDYIWIIANLEDQLYRSAMKKKNSNLHSHDG